MHAPRSTVISRDWRRRDHTALRPSAPGETRGAPAGHAGLSYHAGLSCACSVAQPGERRLGRPRRAAQWHERKELRSELANKASGVHHKSNT